MIGTEFYILKYQTNIIFKTLTVFKQIIESLKTMCRKRKMYEVAEQIQILEVKNIKCNNTTKQKILVKYKV